VAVVSLIVGDTVDEVLVSGADVVDGELADEEVVDEAVFVSGALLV
jgi:hypothetical protein